MPYKRRRGIQRRRPVRRIRQKHRRASQAVRQRNANTAAINKLTRQVYAPRQFQLVQTGTIDQYTHLYPIVYPSEWNPCFQNYNSTASTGVGSTYHISGVKTRWMIQPESIIETTNNVWVQVFIVSLRPYQGRKFRRDNMTLTDEYHFTYAPLDTVAGLSEGFTHIMLNREIFNIHYSSGQRHLGNETLIGDEVNNLRDTQIHGNTYTPWKRTIKGDSAATQIQQLSNSDIRDSAQLYFLVFSNAMLDKEIFYTVNHTIYGSSTRGV
jgi:hypothetical protein